MPTEISPLTARYVPRPTTASCVSTAARIGVRETSEAQKPSPTAASAERASCCPNVALLVAPRPNARIVAWLRTVSSTMPSTAASSVPRRYDQRSARGPKTRGPTRHSGRPSRPTTASGQARIVSRAPLITSDMAQIAMAGMLSTSAFSTAARSVEKRLTIPPGPSRACVSSRAAWTERNSLRRRSLMTSALSRAYSRSRQSPAAVAISTATTAPARTATMKPVRCCPITSSMRSFMLSGITA